MLRRFGSYVRDQWMGALALFLVLGSGSAYAVTQIDANSVRSHHIVNGAVQAFDVAENAGLAKCNRPTVLNASSTTVLCRSGPLRAVAICGPFGGGLDARVTIRSSEAGAWVASGQEDSEDLAPGPGEPLVGGLRIAEALDPNPSSTTLDTSAERDPSFVAAHPDGSRIAGLASVRVNQTDGGGGTCWFNLVAFR